MTYEQKKQALINELRSSETGSIGLGKDTSNLFRNRSGSVQKKLNVRHFNEVIAVNTEEQWVEVEGMTTYEKLTDHLLPFGFMPAVVPQLKSITIGGATVGVGIEATSFRHGLVHETILEMEILLPDGSVVACTPTNEHRDLFFGFPNSYGTLGYALKLKAKIIPVKKYVQVTHAKFSDASAYFKELERACSSSADFVDGVVFSEHEMVVSTGKFIDQAPVISDYTYKNIYYQSLQEKNVDYLTAHDYIWRWDTDWFWCSKNLYMHNPVMRMIMGKKRLNSKTYTKLMRWSAKWKISDKLNRVRGVHAESVIQDIAVPIDRCDEFIRFLFDEINILPIWTCPTKAVPQGDQFPLFSVKSGALMIDFGFWDIIESRERHPRGFFNRKVEVETERVGGIKSLYSESFYPEEEFWRMYNKPAYDALKKQYDPQDKLKDLYQKCVLGH